MESPPLGLYVVAYPVRFEKKNQHAAGEVLQGSAQCHTYCHAGRGEERQETRSLYSQNAYHNHHKDEIEHYLYHAEHECAQRLVDVAAFENSVYQAIVLADYESADVEHRHGYRQVYGEGYHGGYQFGDKLVGRQCGQHMKLVSGVGHGIGQYSRYVGYLK